MKSIIKNGKVIAKDFSAEKYLDIYIKNGVICKIGENLEEEGAEIFNAEGKYI